MTLDNVLQLVGQLQLHVRNEVDGWSAQTVVLGEKSKLNKELGGDLWQKSEYFYKIPSAGTPEQG